MRAAICGALLALALYWPVLAGKAPFPTDIVLNFPAWESERGGGLIESRHAEMGDLVTQMYPWRKFARDAVRSGELPLWNPYLLLGFPHAANLQSAVFYPPTALYYLLPAPLAWSLTFPLRTALACFFTAVLAARLGAGPLGATAAGLAFACSGFMVGWQGWAHADSALWIPAGMLAVHRLWLRPDGRSVALAAGAFALAVLAGHPNLALHAALAAAGYALFRCVLSPAGTRARFGFCFCAAAALGAGLAAIQLLPTFEWLSHLVRPAGGFISSEGASTYLLALLSRDASINPNSAGVEVPTQAAYAGMLALLAAPLAFLGRRKAEAAFAALLALGGMALAYGSVLLELGLALLAGLGLHAVREQPSPRRARGLLAGAGLAAAAGLAILGCRAAGRQVDPFFSPNGLASSAVYLVVALVVLAAAAGSRLRPTFGRAVLSLQVLDLLGYAYGHVPFFARERIYPEPEVYRDLKARGALAHRVLSLDTTMPGNAEVVFGLSSPAGDDYVMKLPARLLRPFDGAPPDAWFSFSPRSALVAGMQDRRLDLMAVRFLIASTDNHSAEQLATRPDRFRLVAEHGSLRVYENLRALPRAFLVPAEGVQVVADVDRLWKRLADPRFRPEDHVLLEVEPVWPVKGAAVARDGPGGTTPPGQVLAIDARLSSVLIRVRVDRPTVLVLADLHYPGWTVRVGEAVSPLLRTNGAFRGVALGPGLHQVRFVYSPVPFWIGAGLTAASAAVCIALGLSARRRYGSPPPPVRG